MSQKTHYMHGRDHQPGGADPIPNWPTGGGVSYNPPPSQPLNVLLSTAFGFDNGWSQRTIDQTVYGGGYRTQASPTVAGHWCAFPCTLGPKGSVWAVTFVYRFGPSYGHLVIDWASSSEDGLPGATGFVGEGLMQQPFDVTFVTPFPGGAVDAYNASVGFDGIIERTASFRVMGDVGDTLTAFGTDSVTGRKSGNGGPGQYWVRFRVDSKNAASSGYQFGLQYAAVERYPGG
jgi:hypothetical protein